MRWSGMEPGDAKALAVGERIHRRLQRLLQVVALNWTDMGLRRFPYAKYRDEGPDVLASILGSDAKEDPDLFLIAEFVPRDEDADTFLVLQFKAERQRTAKTLVDEASRRKSLRLTGMWPADVKAHEWLVCALPLSRVESQPPEGQLAQITSFIKEAALAVEESGILDVELPRKKVGVDES